MGASHSDPDIQGWAFEPTTGDDPAAVSGHRIIARLGTSALGRVYFAHASGGVPVALTVVRPELAAVDGFAARFHHDAQEAGRVRAPGAVPVVGSGQEGGRFWIATALVPALPLDAAVARTGPLATRVVLRLVAGLAETLQALHHAGVVHGDLRPAHVLLAVDGPKVTGYGLAAAAAMAATAATTTTLVASPDAPTAEAPACRAPTPAAPAADAPADGSASVEVSAPVGGPGPAEGSAPAEGPRVDPGADTGPAFLAPEQVAGRPAIPATDVFALGLAAAYASIGRPPFDDPARVQHDEPDLNELPGELREIVTRCLIKEPGLRPSLAQVTTMCAQAVPAGPRPEGWLPPALLATLAPAPPAAPAVPGLAPVPAPVPVPGHSPGGPLAPPPRPPGAPGAGGPHWPHLPGLPHLPPMPHLPLTRPRRRAAGGVAAAVGLVVAVTAGIALAGGLGGSGQDAAQGKGFGATAPAAAPTSPGRASPAPGRTPPSDPSDPAGTPDPADPAAPSDPAAGDAYPGLTLAPGQALALRDDPPAVQPDASGGPFGFSSDGRSFVADPHQALLTVLAPQLPSTAGSCRSGTGPEVTSVPLHALRPGSGRVCVRLVDGTVALVTLRQVNASAGSARSAVVDVTVWRLLDMSAENDL